jgi:translation initiation factor 1
MSKPSDGRLVYSTDPKLMVKCDRCKELKLNCTCLPDVEVAKNKKGSHTFTAVLRLEKQARGGKTVTVIDRLPKNETFLKELCTLLKKKCGTGGTYSLDGKEGVIEIQGDKRDQLRKLLELEGIKFKG